MSTNSLLSLHRLCPPVNDGFDIPIKILEQPRMEHSLAQDGRCGCLHLHSLGSSLYESKLFKKNTQSSPSRYSDPFGGGIGQIGLQT